ncbi:dehalogenase [Betaproteobacteria bacterium]|nr:dehalogenase [Betaproteobacteria bacterium]
MQTNPFPEVQALFFDVFSTVVDWRNGVAREAERILKPLGYSLDWLVFADAWRALYQPGMEEVRSGQRPFVKVDVINQRALDQIRPRFGLEKLDEVTLAELNLAWSRLDAWPDVGPGFARLRARLRLCPCSNGSIAIMAELGRRNDLRWHTVLGSEIAQDYKPKPRVYLASAEALNLKPSQYMMVAAHSLDLIAAAAQGLRTGHVGRPGEAGPGTGETEPMGRFDVVAKDFLDFAAKMGT